MGLMKGKLGFAVFVLCLVLIVGAVLYFLFGMSDNSTMMEGTLVHRIISTGEMQV